MVETEEVTIVVAEDEELRKKTLITATSRALSCYILLRFVCVCTTPTPT